MLRRIVYIVSLILILLSIGITIPLTIKTIDEGDGTWGFGVIGLPVLLPLSAYIFFGIAGVLKKTTLQWKVFLAAHVITLLLGFVTLSIMPVYPAIFALIPFLLFILSVLNKKRFRYFLLIIVCMAIVANVLLMKWELDFHRTLPLLQLL